MTIIQLLITGVAIVGVIVIVLAIIPSLLDYPRGRDGRIRSAGTDPTQAQTIIATTRLI